MHVLAVITALAGFTPLGLCAGRVATCPVAVAPVVATAPLLDGELADSAWQDAAALGPFVTIEGRPAANATVARVVRHNDTLFVAVTCPGSPGGRMEVRGTTRDSDVWTGECIEVFLDPGPSLSRYVHLMVNPDNVQRDESGDTTRVPLYDVGWDGAWRSATARTESGWTCELAIPLADLALPPDAPALIGLNVCRNDTTSGELTCWSPTLSGFHVPVRFGLLSAPAAPVAWPLRLSTAGPEDPRPGRVEQLVALANQHDRALSLELLTVAGNADKRTEQTFEAPELPALGARSLALSFDLSEPGDNALVIAVRDGRGNAWAVAKTVVSLSGALAQAFGYRIPAGEDLGLWWAESTYKIHRDTPMPQTAREEMEVSAAAREFEAVQLVLKPSRDCEVTLSISDLTGQGTTLPADCVKLYQVEYVPVTIPSDSFGWPGDWPDPLPPIQGPIHCVADRNQPIWVLIYVPPGTPGGWYHGHVKVTSQDATVQVPLRLRVWNFELTPETHTRTAYGVYPDFGFLGITDEAQRREVFDLYMQSFRDHRISPYDPMAFYPMDIRVQGPGYRFSYGAFAVNFELGQSSPWKLLWDGREVAWQQTSQTHFEREGEGWQGTGLGWPYVGTTESVTEVYSTDSMRVLDVVSVASGSQPCARSYKLRFRFWIPAGDYWFAMKLMEMQGMDPNEVEVREYFNIPHTAFRAHAVANGPDFSAWADETLGFGMICLGAQVGGLGIAEGASGITVSNPTQPFRIREGQSHEGWGPLVVYFLTTDTSSIGLAARAAKLATRIDPTRLEEYTPAQPQTLAVQHRTDFTFTHDFARFDEGARRYLDEFHFNGFNLPCMPADIGGHPRFSDEYKRLHRLMYGPVMQHLRDKGWLQWAYSYWYDEPEEHAYPYVIQGMELLRENCPGLTRLLTEQPEPSLYGHVDLWVPVLALYDAERCHERQAAGELVWWYVCCGPRAPYPNNFVDHPAINHRIRSWMAEKYGVTGELYWSTTYYGPLPDGSPRNPWTEGMTYTPDGKGTWGNGDGMLLYPFCREPSKEPVIRGPVESIRWEMLRDGIEDREYFWVLRQEVARLQALRSAVTGDRAAAIDRALDNAARALNSPNALIQSLVKYTKDPQDLLRERDGLAAAIEMCREL